MKFFNLLLVIFTLFACTQSIHGFSCEESGIKEKQECIQDSDGNCVEV